MHFIKKIQRQIESSLNLEISRVNTNDPKINHIIKSVKNRTMTCSNRLLNLIESIDYVHQNKIMGSIVECGVWRGGSALAIKMRLMQLKSINYDLYLFDTFGGMTEPNKIDYTLGGGSSAELLLSKNKSRIKSGGYSNDVLAYSSLEDVISGFKENNVITDNVYFIKGDVRTTLLNKKNLPRNISILRLDTDFYDSTMIELRTLWPLLSKGGVLIVDDYDFWNGSKVAVDNYFEEIKINPLKFRMKTGRVILKI